MAGIIKVDRVQSDSNLAFQVGSANVAFFDVTEGIKLGNTKIGTSLVTTNGIVFPSTQITSSDPNTLDDYEEGSWTPSLNLLGSVSYSYQQGRYTKVGRKVSISFYMVLSSTDTTQDGSIMYINGLPFIVANDSAPGTSCMMTERLYASNAPTVPNTFHCQASGGTTSLWVAQNNYNGGITNASYFVSMIRSGYKGGNLYMLGQHYYETT